MTPADRNLISGNIGDGVRLAAVPTTSFKATSSAPMSLAL